MADPYSPDQIPLAIVGMACRLPGADDLDQYWRMLVEGRDAVEELPPDRLDQDMYFDPEVGVRGKTYSKLGAIISSRTIDYNRLPIDPKLAAGVDLAHLLMCDVAASALRHAGIDPFNVPLRNTGVYIGHAQGSTLGGDHTYATCMPEAAEFLRETPAFGQLTPAEQEAVIGELIQRVRAPLPHLTAVSPDVSASLVAGTISKAFGLNGPYLAINSACASSLQAMLLAARALQLGRVDMAIVGGASDCKSDSLVLFSHARAMSATGTRPFDAGADGLICGEGYVALVLKTLKRALDDGDKIWAVVRGLGVSSDGKGKSLWAPRKEGQTKAMERAHRTGLDVADLDYVEAHATATQLGDATELNTLQDILGKHFPPGKRIPITSVKANIGHTLETSGIAGVIKAVLAIHNDTVAPAINIRQLNANIDWSKSPVYVPTTAQPWPRRADGKPRRAGCNAFGIGGLNMHVVVEEFLDSSRALAAAAPGPPRENLPTDDQAIAVIGLGCVLPGAENPQAFWNLLAAGTDPKSPVPPDRWRPEVAMRDASHPMPEPSALVGGFISDFEYDWKRHKVPPKQVQQADPLQFMLLEATDQAMQDAGYDVKAFERENVGVVVGTEFGGDFSFQLQLGLRLPELQRHIETLLVKRGLRAEEAQQAGKDYAQILLKQWPALIDETGSFSTSSLASRIGKTWNLMGGAAAIDAGQSSGLAALSTSVDMLLARDCDLMICAAGQRRMGWPIYASLALAGGLAPGQPRSPLDADAQGGVPGEGVVVVLLKRLADAQRDGDQIHAVLRGVGGAHDHSSWGTALELAMERSFTTRAQPSDVAVMELDALGDQNTTADEVRAVAKVYGKDSRQQPLMLSSVSGQLGNTQGAASLVSLLKAILEVSHGQLPRPVGIHSPAPCVTQHGHVVSAPTSETPIDPTTADGRRLAAVAICSRGLAYHALLERGSRVEVQAATSAPQLATAPASAAAPAAVDLGELEQFLINFVVEQTGYPPEVVELDADLEADLGIDSIKKAQMFGELQEYFDVTPTDDLTLDDFPTLRHIVSFLAKTPAKENAPVSNTASVPPSAPAPVPAASIGTTAVATAPVTPVAQAAPQPSTATTAWQICRFGAVDAAALRAMVTAAQQDVSAFQSSMQRRFTAQDCHRLAVVADNAATLNARLATAVKQMHNPAARTVLEQQGVFYREANPDTRVVFLFPGQGSQYTGMLRQLVQDVPAAEKQRAAIDDSMTRLGFPTWAQLAWDEASPLGRDVWTTQISMLLSDVLMLAVMRDRGIEPDLVAGHSYGEYPALFAAGAWNLEQAIRVTRRRCEAIDAQPGGHTGLLATTATPETVENLTSRLSGPAFVASLNAPDQTVVGGTLQALAELEPMLQEGLFETRLLAVPSAFHTPLMRDAAAIFAGHIAGEAYAMPRVTTYSVANNEPVSDPQQIGQNLVAHLTKPLRYADLIRKLAAQGPAVFVEVGPQQALTRLNRRILPPQELNGIACDNPSRPGLEQLVRVQALLECSGALDRPRNQPHAPAAATAAPSRGQIWHFDATARRRDKMRAASNKASQPAAAPTPATVPPVSTAPSPAPAPAPVVVPTKPKAISPAPAPPPAVTASVDLAQLEQFLINFVVEQTGYPPEVVELDADLEADLGIDSIKKAQMFGELQEYFDVTPTDDLTLDDFPTLRHIVNFLAKAPTKQDVTVTNTASPSPSAPTPAPAPAAQPAPPPAATPPRVIAATASAATAATTTTTTTTTVDTSELEQFLVNFVVEQTGYPPEVVELDADLEADLGIDSIKKAQMFGELQEYFDVTPTDDLTLDDFPTLRHIVNFLAKAPTKQDVTVTNTASPSPSAPTPAPAPAAQPAPPPAATPPQVIAATASAATAATTTTTTTTVDTSELEQFLVNFVVEQTGYPPEVVELDADLEADLGIDSIKKAQMFGELQEYFDVTPTADLTLDDFPTLRHIVNFLAKAPTKDGIPATAAGNPTTPAPAAATPHSAGSAGVTAAASARIDVLHVRGTPYEQGFQHGAEKKAAILALLRRGADLTNGDLSEMPITPDAWRAPERFFTPSQLEELRGMADAVEVPFGNLAALNLAVLADFAANVAQLALVPPAGPPTQVLHGLSGELSLPSALTEMLTPLVLVREPAQGWASATVTFAGLIGSPIGLNGNGLAASSATLVDTVATHSVGGARWTVHVDGLLQRNGTLEHATEELRHTDTQRGWTACLSHPSPHRVAAVEHNGTTLAEHSAEQAVYAANHCVLHRSQTAAPRASAERFDWLKTRLAQAEQPRDAGELLTILGEIPSQGSLRVLVVVDTARGDLLIDCGSIRERVHIGALLPSSPAGDPDAFRSRGNPELPVAAPAPTAPDAAPSSADLQEPSDVDPESMRFVLRMVPIPWDQRPPDFPQWKGAVAIQGNNPLAEALAAHVASSGATVVRLQETSSPEAAVVELERAWKQQPIVHLFLTALRDETALDRSQVADFEAIYNRQMLLTYFLCQRQMQLVGDAKRLGDCTVVAAVDLGGDFGFSGNVASPESGFITGLMKSLLVEYQIMREQEGFVAKAVDAPRSEPVAELAANLCRELAQPRNDYEVSFIGGKRYLQVALPVAAAMEPLSEIRPGSTWVLTGGARGITAECGLQLARRFGLKLHLIGTTPLPTLDPAWRDLDEQQTASLRSQVIIEARRNGQKPNDAWARIEKAMEIDRNLRAFAESDIKVTYHTCDVADRAALAQVLDEVRRIDGPIEGILHAAGIEQSCRFEKKTLPAVRATVGAKVLGAYYLMELTRSDPVQHFIGFGSISGRLGSNGQTDYAAASDMLCKLISWYRTQRPACRTIGFHFHPWDSVGMAVRPDTVAMLKATNLRRMPKRTGLAHLFRELYAKQADTELIITDWEYHQRYYGTAVRETAKRTDLLGAPGQPVPAPEAASSKAQSCAEIQRIADRVLLRMADAPLTNPGCQPLPSSAFLLGNNPAADALAESLTAGGVTVQRLPASGDASAVCAALEQAFERTPARCLLLCTGRDPEAANLDDQAHVTARVQHGVYLPYWVTRRWYQLVNEKPEAGLATIVALTSLGGDFGFAEPVASPEGGSLTGLLKSIFVEDARYDHARFKVKVVDAPAHEQPAQLAAAVCHELRGGEPEVEVAWANGQRQVVAVAREPIAKPSLGELPHGGVWVITGGARGITAATALELGRRYGLKLHLLGKSPAPEAHSPWLNCTDDALKALKAEIVRKATQQGRVPTDDWGRICKDREIQTSLDKFAAAGVSATYHACDVADWDGIDRVLKTIRATDGPITGIVHGAGFANSCRFGTGSGNKLEATIAPKIDGTLALMHLTASDPLRYFVGFGSLSGRFGGNGLSDYAAANDALAKICGWFRSRRPECQTVCFHWQTWDAVGMALLSDGVGITKNAFKMDFISPAEGVNHLIDELRAGAPESEVLITDGFFQRQFYPYDLERPAASAKPPTASAAASARTPVSRAPLIDAWEPGSAAAGVARIKFDPVNDPFLSQHRLKQKPFLPGVVGVESLLQAARCAIGRDGVAEIHDVRIVNGMSFPTGTLAARVEVAAADGGWECRLMTEQRDRQGRLIDADRLHVTGVVPTAPNSLPMPADPPGQPPLGWFPHAYPDDGLLFHGVGLRCLQACAYQYDGGWGQIVAPPLSELAGARGGEGWSTPIAVLDACVVACGSFLFLQFGGVVEVPFEFQRLRVTRHPAPGENCVVRLYFRERGERHSRFDFTLFGNNDEPLVQVVGYRTIRVGAGGP